ncbi:MAG: Asp23/Gls24 family envelope stress response protein [Clostridiaceae bacterium]|nr:Asp23/Gls24 family envelope stress response protein [Clostridiaceae bacterium]
MDSDSRQFSIKGERTMSQGFIAQYAAEAALHTPGVSGLNTGIASGLKEAIGLVPEGRGVRVSFRSGESDDVVITVYLDVLYGHVMPEIAWSVQERVKRDVERFTGLNVDAVNVHVVRVTEGGAAPQEDLSLKAEQEDYL